jgi:hypothetical protein
VMNRHGINCLNFLEKPGAVVTTEPNHSPSALKPMLRQ